ncbi:MAG: molybdopterin-dependent oxidoreductase [Geminicoccaceae bacterium]
MQWRQALAGYLRPREAVDLSPRVADEVTTTTCYMCACRCGIRVHLKDGRVRFIDGNSAHPVNHGVVCGKGAAGPMQQASPAKLKTPLLRVGERGEGRFKEISWEQALGLATEWLGEVRARDPKKLAFYTGRDQSQALTGAWAASFGTPNYAAHGGFCSVNMAAAGLYTVGGSFWEFGEPDYERTKYLMLWGVAEDHDSNPIKIGLSKLKARGAKIVVINPVRTGYGALADEWVPIRPGTDGLLITALIHELLRTRAVDVDYLDRMTDASWLLLDEPGSPEHGLYLRDAEGKPLRSPPEDGRHTASVFQLLAQRYLDPACSPDAVAERCGVFADTIRRLASELATVAFDQAITIEQPWTDVHGVRHERFVGRPVAMHAMRGISAHANGFQTCRALHVLQLLLGTVDVPGGWRYKAPFPRPTPQGPPPTGRPEHVCAGEPLPGPVLGFPTGPEHLLVDGEGRPSRIDKAFSWEAPLAIHGMLHTVIANAHAGDPYPIDVLFLFMANMAWNSAMSTAGTRRMLADKDPATGAYRIPRFIYCDAYHSETVDYADLVLPDTTYLERWDCISLLDRPIGHADGPGDAVRRPVLQPDRDVRPFQDVLIDLGARLKLPAFTKGDGTPRYPGLYPDYIVNHERRPGIGLLAGWRGPGGRSEGRGDANPDQLDAYLAHDCFWHREFPPEARFMKTVNRDYLEAAVNLGLLPSAEPIPMHLWCEPLQRFRLAAEGHGPVQPPDHLRERVRRYCDPLPSWYPPTGDEPDFPLHAVTQRPMPMYHSWGSQNRWLRQILTRNRLQLHPDTAASLGIADDDRVRVVSAYGSIEANVHLTRTAAPHTVWTWNAIGKGKGAWTLPDDAPEMSAGFLLNDLIPDLLPDGLANADPITGQGAWYDLKVRIERLA